MGDLTAVAKLMECLDCKKLMRSPISSCIKGYISICAECKQKLKVCPLCKCSCQSDGRNYGLKRLIKYPCKNNNDGCEEKVLNHEGNPAKFEPLEMVDAIAKLMECLVCKELMRPPILLCIKGHSICAKCQQKLKVCPLCKCSWQPNGRNYGLERLADLLKYPCINNGNGCKETGFLISDAIKHEMSCQYSEIECPIESCTWKESFIKLKDHIDCEHLIYFVNSKYQSSSNDSINDYYFTYHGKNIFKVIIDKGTSTTIFKILHVSLPHTKSNFEFTIHFEDQTNSDQCLEIIKNCDHISTVNPEGVVLQNEHLRCFVDKDRLWYRITFRDI